MVSDAMEDGRLVANEVLARGVQKPVGRKELVLTIAGDNPSGKYLYFNDFSFMEL